MKIFGELERQVIKGFVEGANKNDYLNNLSNLLNENEDLLPEGYYLEASHLPNHKNIWTYKASGQFEKDSGNPIINFQIRIYNLLEYLESEKLITIYPIGYDPELCTAIGKAKPKTKGIQFDQTKQVNRADFFTDDIREKMYRPFVMPISVSPELVEYVENDFMTIEEKTRTKEVSILERQLKHTRAGFYLTLLGLVISLAVSGATLWNNINGQTKIKIDDSYRNQVSDDLNALTNEVSNLSNSDSGISKQLESMIKTQNEISNHLEGIYKK